MTAKRKLGNIAPEWPICADCKTYKADTLMEETDPDGFTHETPLCANCAFKRGWAVEERFVLVWRRRM